MPRKVLIECLDSDHVRPTMYALRTNFNLQSFNTKNFKYAYRLEDIQEIDGVEVIKPQKYSANITIGDLFNWPDILPQILKILGDPEVVSEA